MSDTTLVASVKAAMKAAMKARDKERLGTIRLIQAEFKRIEVDERVEVDDARALAVLDKMVKQRRDSATQYHDAGRSELAEQEEREIAVLQEFLPAQLSEADIIELVDAAIAAAGASGMQAMGAVMGQVKPQVQGRADMGEVSKIVKARLAAG
ncbi:GatB/YqeY domain-containing protein [Parahaliea mediterranea]|uniref:GatB/YqeY domain-containing protein n=1 Tax=Parahaliea mediterranea TaxID=651086 RepID=UPI000E2F8393|nr:GatB/YqeY domain-containing protein [Parahaliea mediterranea]